MRIGTFNIQHGRNYKKYLETGKEFIELSVAADKIKEMQLDVCGLNEVRNQEGINDLVDQAKVIGDCLGYHTYFAKAIDLPAPVFGEYGNAIVSKYPIISVETYPIALSEGERPKVGYYESRVLLVARLDVDGKELTFMSTHFGLTDAEKEKALRVVLTALDKIDTPLVLAGDLNISPSHPVIKSLSERLVNADEYLEEFDRTYIGAPMDPAFKWKIDHIFVKGLKIGYEKIEMDTPSDHRPIYISADFE